MDKYYVQSGNVRSVVHAESSRKAALWAIHKVMQQILPIDQASTPSGQRSTNGLRQETSVLCELVKISKRGFDRPDATELATMDVVTQWNEMVTTLDRLERMF